MEQLTQFISKHWELWLALIIILILIFINEVLSKKKRAAQLSPSVAVDMINDDKATVIDLRDEETYRNGHIIHSIRASAEDFHQGRMDKFKSKPVILVCARGVQAAALATSLKEKGFEQPMVLAGGIDAWKAANLPTVKAKKK